MNRAHTPAMARLQVTGVDLHEISQSCKLLDETRFCWLAENAWHKVCAAPLR